MNETLVILVGFLLEGSNETAPFWLDLLVYFTEYVNAGRGVLFLMRWAEVLTTFDRLDTLRMLATDDPLASFFVLSKVKALLWEKLHS